MIPKFVCWLTAKIMREKYANIAAITPVIRRNIAEFLTRWKPEQVALNLCDNWTKTVLARFRKLMFLYYGYHRKLRQYASCVSGKRKVFRKYNAVCIKLSAWLHQHHLRTILKHWFKNICRYLYKFFPSVKTKKNKIQKINEQKITAYCITHFSFVKFFDVLAIISKRPWTFAYKKQFLVSCTITIEYHAHVAPFDSFTDIWFNLLATCLFEVNIKSVEVARLHRCLKIW